MARATPAMREISSIGRRPSRISCEARRRAVLVSLAGHLQRKRVHNQVLVAHGLALPTWGQFPGLGADAVNLVMRRPWLKISSMKSSRASREPRRSDKRK